MSYTITLGMSGLAQLNLPTATQAAREILERHLGGAPGVEAAYRAAHAVIGPDPRLQAPDGCREEDRAAVDLWQTAVGKVWDALHAGGEDMPLNESAERFAEAVLWIDIDGADLAPY